MLARVHGQRGWANITSVAIPASRGIALASGHVAGTAKLGPGTFSYSHNIAMAATVVPSQSTLHRMGIQGRPRTADICRREGAPGFIPCFKPYVCPWQGRVIVYSAPLSTLVPLTFLLNPPHPGENLPIL